MNLEICFTRDKKSRELYHINHLKVCLSQHWLHEFLKTAALVDGGIFKKRLKSNFCKRVLNIKLCSHQQHFLTHQKDPRPVTAVDLFGLYGIVERQYWTGFARLRFLPLKSSEKFNLITWHGLLVNCQTLKVSDSCGLDNKLSFGSGSWGGAA